MAVPHKQPATSLFGAVWLIAMPSVKMTGHLYRFFPQLKHQKLTVPAGSVAEALLEINKAAPGFTDYVLDDNGTLRRHVNISINDKVIVDKLKLTDHIPEDGTIYIFQALSGG
jgi:sulfur-carrier protein